MGVKLLSGGLYRGSSPSHRTPSISSNSFLPRPSRASRHPAFPALTQSFESALAAVVPSGRRCHRPQRQREAGDPAGKCHSYALREIQGRCRSSRRWWGGARGRVFVRTLPWRISVCEGGLPPPRKKLCGRSGSARCARHRLDRLDFLCVR